MEAYWGCPFYVLGDGSEMVETVTDWGDYAGRDGLSDVCFATPPSNNGNYGNLRFSHLFDDPVYLCVPPSSSVAGLAEAEHDVLVRKTIYIQSSYRGLPSFESLFALESEGVMVVEADFSKDLIMRVMMEGEGPFLCRGSISRAAALRLSQCAWWAMPLTRG